jgi:DNA polymerase-3 subunit alpha
MAIGDVDRITKLVPTTLNIKLKDAFEQEPAFGEMRKKDPRVDQVLNIATSLEGMARNCSIHAAGVVISPSPLKHIVPLYRTNKDEIVTQYDMNGLEKLGLLKMDFLGLTTLTIIDDALALIRRYRGEELRIEDLPLDDPKAYDVFTKGFTSGVFQFESRGMRDILMRYQPTRLEDLCALNALYRPGPIQGGMVDDFIDRKHGRKRVVYELPDLQEILSETYGVIVYQEQVMQVANKLAGYSLGDADLLRRAMGKKKPEEMAKQRATFMKGALERGYPEKKAAHIFDLMEQFAGYGFNKSHSAAYAYLAYVTAYLKAHYSLEFLSALLTSETGNTAKVVKYINECRDMGIRVLSPDVNKSDKNFSPDGEAIRFGLCAIRNVGESAVDSILAARREGPYKSIFDFCERVDLTSVNRRMIESLIRAGAMDGLRGTRSQLFAVIDGAMEAGQRVHRDRMSGQAGLFAMAFGPADEAPEPDLPTLPDWTDAEKLAGEKEMLGFYVTGHPLDEWKDKVCELATHNSETLSEEEIERGANVVVCGMMSGIQRRRNKKGELWASFTLEDHLGAIECMVFSTQYERLLSELKDDQAVMIRAMALPEEGAATRLSVQEIVPLSVCRVALPSLISIKVRIAGNGTEKAEALHQLFERKKGDSEVRLRLEKPRDFAVVMDVTTRVRPDKEFRAEVERICGPESLEVLAN